MQLPGAPQQGLPQSPPPTGQPQISPEIMKMIMQALSAMPDVPAGGMSHSSPAGAVPQMAKQPSPQELQLKQMMSMLNQQPANMQGGLQGIQGGMSGGLGGRPRGT